MISSTLADQEDLSLHIQFLVLAVRNIIFIIVPCMKIELIFSVFIFLKRNYWNNRMLDYNPWRYGLR